jgi:branched-chain amino acid transport system permease protein
MKAKGKLLYIGIPILAILLTLPLYSSDYYLLLLINILMYATLAVSWIIFSSYTGYISLATAAFFGIGAYCTALFWPALPFPVLIIMGGVVSMLFAFLIGFPCLKIRGPYFIILTLGLSELVRHAVHLFEVQVLGEIGHVLVGGPSTQAYFYILLAIGIASIIAAHLIKSSRFGLGLLSIKGNEDAAQAMGVDTTRYKIIAFGISAMFMGLVGAVIALRWTYIDTNIAFNPTITFSVIIMAILGGMADFRGPVLGAIIMVLLQEAFGIQFPYFYMIIMGLVLILIIKFLPIGILGKIDQLWAKRREKMGLSRGGE